VRGKVFVCACGRERKKEKKKEKRKKERKRESYRVRDTDEER